ncbi:MAG TPA: hypothetical protein VK477_09340, partial [Acidobacteriota bacterium]|nr:hypothetical protein [Acidobacteriota bacterium]
RVWRLSARGTAGGEPCWKPTGRPWEGRLGAGAGWDLERDVPRWVEFDLALLHDATEAVRAELWLAVWPAADATGIVIVIDGDGREIGRALRGAAGAAAFARADVAAALQAARVRGDATLRLGLLNGGSTAVAVDAPDDPDPFEPQLLVWTSRE